MKRFILALMLLLLGLTACGTTQPVASPTPIDPESLLQTGINNLRQVQSFRILVEQGGTPFQFYFQLGPEEAEFATAMTRTEGAFIAPNELYANARIRFSGVPVSVELFANTGGQWIRALSGSWIGYEYAPGFDPAIIMAEDRGFQNAINRLTDVTLIGEENRTGREVVHIRGETVGDVINDILFGLLYILDPLAVVDVYIDKETQTITEMILTLPDTATETTPDTFWRFEMYDFNTDFELDRPAGAG